MEWVDKDFFGLWGQFKEDYLVTNRFGKIVDYKNLDGLYKEVQSCMIRRTYDSPEVAEQIPELIEEVLPLSPGRDQQKFLDYCVRIIKGQLDELIEAGEWDGKNVRAGSVFKFLVFLDRVGIDPQYTEEQVPEELKPFFEFEDGSGSIEGIKVTETLNLINDIVLTGESVVVFCRYLSGLRAVRNRLPAKYKSFIYTGKQTETEKALQLARFRNEATKQGAILLASDAGKESINVPEAKYVINIDVPWGHSEYTQRISRIRRVDSRNKTVVAIQLLIPGLDEYKFLTSQWKGNVSDQVVDGAEEQGKKPKILDFLVDNKTKFDGRIV
jgi:SNF2 family DNA or RNA helicase